MTWNWGEEVKTRVRDLYISQDKPLDDVIKIVNEEFRVLAKKRTYQKHLREWGFSKKNTHCSKRVRKPNQRTIKPTFQGTRQALIDGINGNIEDPLSGHTSLVPDELAGLEAQPFPEDSVPDMMDGFYHGVDKALDPTPFPDFSSDGIFYAFPNATNPALRSSGDIPNISDAGPSSHTTILSTIGNEEHSTETDESRFQEDDGAGGSSTVRNGIDKRPIQTNDLKDELKLSPLAIQIAVEYINAHDISSLKYVELHRQTSQDFTWNTDHSFSEEKYAEAIAFEISLQKLTEKDGRLLLFCSFLDSNDIALEILVRFLKHSLGSTNRSISTLLRYRLVFQKNPSESISIDPKIHTWLRDRVPLSQRSIDEREMVMEISSSIALGYTPSKEDWAFARLIIPHLGAIIKTLLRYRNPESFWNKESLKAAATIADVARRLGENEKSNRILKHILPLSESILGERNSQTLDTMNALSVTLMGKQKWEEAENLLHRLTEARRQSPDISESAYVTELSNWARVLVKLGHNDKAQDALELISERGKHILVGNHSETMRFKIKLGETYRFCGRLMEAEGLLLKVHKESRQILGEGHPKTLRVLEILCYVYSDQGNLVAAEIWGSELVKSSEKTLGKKQTDTVRRVKFLAGVCRKKNKLRK